LSSTSPTEQTRKEALYTTQPMHRLPNQISSERADLLVRIERCRRLASTVTDEVTIQKLLALAAEYELQLNQTQHR
jgi:hypothetical protein